MNEDTNNLVPITDANRNFSGAARKADESGPAMIRKNNPPRCPVMDCIEAEKVLAASDVDVLAVSAYLIAKNREAYEVLAK